ncbi:hypothetical protein [Tianweitania sp.]|uniref:hypothetical protein n=1 Tax=Tianweitania sp. TaxID=2021634 RepID=UPI00289B2948|nr:hypothetical protein [Tianweitania sp.]
MAEGFLQEQASNGFAIVHIARLPGASCLCLANYIDRSKISNAQIQMRTDIGSSHAVRNKEVP